MATEVEQAIAECRRELETFAPKHEGLRDYASINLEKSAKAAVKKRIEAYDRRVDLLQKVIAAGESLMADGHPGMPVAKLDPSSYADLRVNADTIAAALGEFSGDALDDLGLTAGEPQPKA